MLQMRFTPADANLVRFENGLTALGDHGARKVMARALNRAGGPSLTAVRRMLAQETSAPMKIIKRAVVGRKAWSGEAGGSGKLEFVIEATGRRLPLRLFKPTEFRFGVRAKVWGKVQRFEGAFMRGGRFPNRVALPELGGNVLVREGSARLPTRIQYGPSLPLEMGRWAVVNAWHNASKRLTDDLAHELDRELMKAVT